MMLNFLANLYRFVRARIFVNDTILLFQHNTVINNTSPAIIKYATHENISDVLNFNKPHYIPVFHNFLKNGDRGYFAYLNNKCVHRSWIQFGPQEVEPHWATPMQLNSHEIFIRFCETAAEARGKNIFPAVLYKITQDFKDKTIFTSVDLDNTASIRAIEKAGFIKTEKKKIIIILGLKIVKQTNLT
jgi:hypothetical protein